MYGRARLGALYSDFRHLRTSNPDGYTANIEAWQQGLSDAAKEGCIPSRGGSSDALILKVDDELLRALETKEWGRPLALGTVVRDAIAKKELVPIQDFSASKHSIYKRSWGLSPWTVLSWGLRQIGLIDGESADDKVPHGRLVIMKNLEAASVVLSKKLAEHSGRVDRIMSRKEFSKTYSALLGGKHLLSEDDIAVFLRFLSRDKGIAAFDGQTVKLKGPSDDQITITEEDSTIAALKTLTFDLNNQIDSLSNRVNTLAESARDAVARKNRVLAVATLRSKKIAETNLARQSATLGQLEEVYSKIAQAADHVELVRIMEGSTGVLRKLNAEVGGVERVDDIVYELKEQMTQVEEINNAITEVGAAGEIDESEVDDELEAMEAAEKAAELKSDITAREEKEQLEAAETRQRLNALDAVRWELTTKEHVAKATDQNSKDIERSSLEPEAMQ